MEIQTDFYTITPYANLLVIKTFLSWDERIVEKHINDVRAITSRFYQDKTWGLLSDRREWQLSTPAAERFFRENAKSALAGMLSHMAICVGESELKKWQLKNMIKEFSRFEIKFFGDIQEAESWLAAYGYCRTPLKEMSALSHP
nr:hypothetical protein [Desulfobacula sp.]